MTQWVCIDNRGLEKELFLNKAYREIRSEYMEIGLIVLFNEITAEAVNKCEGYGLVAQPA